jgi:putative ABC transport system ATP-binding protein
VGGALTHPIIETVTLAKNYASPSETVEAVRDVSFALHQGSFVAIMGESGSGKTTLLHLLGLLETPSSGVYRLNGEDVADWSDESTSRVRALSIGFVFQSFHLMEQLDVRQNVELAYRYHPEHISRTEVREHALAALEQVGLGHRMSHRPSMLSGGEKQRVAIARAICKSPTVILADEPTGNLDVRNSEAVLQIFGELNRSGATILLVTHDPAVADCATRTLRMHQGVFLPE